MASVLKFAHYIFHLCLWKGKAIKISDSNIERKKIRTQICGNQNSIAKKKRSLTSTALQHWTQIGECPVCTNCGRNMKHRSNRAMEEKVRNTYWFKIRRKLNTFRKRETQKKKSKFLPAHAMKAYRGSSSTGPLVLNLGTVRRQVVKFVMPNCVFSVATWTDVPWVTNERCSYSTCRTTVKGENNQRDRNVDRWHLRGTNPRLRGEME